MKRWYLKCIKVGLLLGGVVFALYVVTIYTINAKPKLVEQHTKVEYKISSKALISAFINDEVIANNTYIEKVIEVDGTVKEITFLNDRITIILNGYEGFSCLICDMNSNQMEKVKAIKEGDSILLKGICKGFLMDAILLNCVLISSSHE